MQGKSIAIGIIIGFFIGVGTLYATQHSGIQTENTFQDIVSSSDLKYITPGSIQNQQTIPTASKIQPNLETLFPTRNQIGTNFRIGETQVLTGMLNEKVLQVLQKKYDNGFLGITIILVKFDSSKDAFDYYQEEKSASYEQGGFEYFPVSAIGATCYDENRNRENNVYYNGYCVKDNIYFNIVDVSASRVSKWAQYVIDNFNNS